MTHRNVVLVRRLRRLMLLRDRARSRSAHNEADGSASEPARHAVRRPLLRQRFLERLKGDRLRPPHRTRCSVASAERLEAAGVRVVDLRTVETLAVYVDGADEVTPAHDLLKGGGGALTREKIVAAAAERFVCIVDESKAVDALGAFPLPVEVIPMARRLVEGRLRDLGGAPVLRPDFVTDNGNHILDVHGLAIDEPAALETRINNIPGVVENGIFAASTRPDTVLVATPEGIRSLP